MTDQLLTVTEVSKLLKCNRNLIYELIRKGLLKPIRLGSLKIRESTLNQFLKDYDGKDFTDLNNVIDYQTDDWIPR